MAALHVEVGGCKGRRVWAGLRVAKKMAEEELVGQNANATIVVPGTGHPGDPVDVVRTQVDLVRVR